MTPLLLKDGSNDTVAEPSTFVPFEELEIDDEPAERAKPRFWSKYSKLKRSHEDKPQKPTRAPSKWPGWRTLILSGGVVILIVLVINISLLATAARSGRSVGTSGHKNDALTFYNGSCSASSKIYSGTHLLTNIASTIIFMTSTACIQVLLAPSRADIDNCHEQHSWIHVGVINYRNFAKIPISRACLAALLAISSLPLHLLWVYYNNSGLCKRR